MTITIRPITPTLGAKVRGVSVPNLSEAQFTEVFAAFIEHGVIFLRDQPQLTAEQHLAFARRFGEIHIHPASRGVPAESPGLMRMRTNRDSRVAAGNRWHSDVSCDAEPPQASILQLHEIPEIGGDTLFSSLAAAYDALSDRMKAMLDGLTALHSGEEPFRRTFQFPSGESEGWPEHDHPVVRLHPESGRPVLFVDREFTHSINDLPKEEARALLEFLFQHTERVAFQCRFVWSQNAIAIWDNRCVLHHAMWDYWPAERRGHRVSVQGERPQMYCTENAAPYEPSTVRLTL